MVIYVHGSWLNSFHRAILASNTSCDDGFRSREVRLCQAARLGHVLADYLAYIFSFWPETSVPIGGQV